ncbi:MAG: hypothetical protein HQK49_13130 [Oligoflexia bacterium]|nr:hypothetical protein [Oligoflexia bacterium]
MKQLVSYISILLFNLIFITYAYAVTVTPEYLQMREELKTDIIKWNKSGDGLANINVWSKRLTAIASIYCGQEEGRPKCALKTISKPGTHLLILVPVFIIGGKSIQQPDLQLEIRDTITDQKTEPIENFVYDNNIRHNYSDVLKVTYHSCEVADPFNPSTKLQEVSDKVETISNKKSGQSVSCLIVDENKEEGPAGEYSYQLVGEERVPSKYVKVTSDGTCTLLDRYEGECKLSSFCDNPPRKDDVFSISTLNKSEYGLYYESDTPIEEGIYEVTADNTIKKTSTKFETNKDGSQIKPLEERFWKISYPNKVNITKKIEDFNYNTILNSIDFADDLINNETVAQIKIKNLKRVKQIILTNWEQLDSTVTLNLIKQKLVGLEEIKIDHKLQHPGEKSEKLLSIIQKIEAELALVVIQSLAIPVEVGRKFKFNLGDANSVDEIKYYVENADQEFSDCIGLKNSEGNNDLSCELTPILINKEYSIVIKKSKLNGSKTIIGKKLFLALKKECAEFLYNEKADPLCGVKEYNAGRDAVCGVESYNSQRGEPCGVELYNNAKNEACGSEVVHRGEWANGGDVDRNFINERLNSMCKAIGFDGTGGISSIRTDSASMGESGQIRRWYTVSFSCVRYNTCRHSNNGVELWRQCSSPSFGVSSYNLCVNAIFGPKTFNVCRDKSFGNEKCIRYAN